jgi:hypothetical protein
MKKVEEKKKESVIIVIFICLILLVTVSMVSAGLLDWLKKTVSGKVSQQPTNITITVSGVNPAIIESVSGIPNTDPVEEDNRSITFYVTMYDADGVSDLNDTSVSSNFTMPGETARESGTCGLVGDIDSNRANYSCMINMWYWDGAGNWTITVRGKDLGNGSWAYNTSTQFQYNLLRAMLITPDVLTWPAITPGADNQTSDNDPTTVNNTGNYNETLEVNAIDLAGESNPSYKIYSENFTVGLTTGGGTPECIGTQLQNATYVSITNSDANPGNLSLGGGSGQEDFYYCITKVPSLSSQTYSTSQGGSWIIRYPVL